MISSIFFLRILINLVIHLEVSSPKTKLSFDLLSHKITLNLSRCCILLADSRLDPKETPDYARTRP